MVGLWFLRRVVLVSKEFTAHDEFQGSVDRMMTFKDERPDHGGSPRHAPPRAVQGLKGSPPECAPKGLSGTTPRRRVTRG